MRYGATVGRKRNCRVFAISRGPEGEVVIGWEGWEGIRVRARNCALRRERWSFTGRVRVSA